jgi:hypothetical protein
MFGLAQGTFVEGSDPGAPALPSTGSLLRVNRHGGFDVIEGGLNLPTSMEIIGNTAYVVGLAGDIVKIKNIGKKSHGRHRCKYHH